MTATRGPTHQPTGLLPDVWRECGDVTCAGVNLSVCVSPQWHAQATCATQGTGLYEGLDWLSNELAKH